MRLQALITTDSIGLEIPSEYRRTNLSYIKSALTKYHNGEFFKEFYDSNRPKSFSFAFGLPKGCAFSGDKIILPETNSHLRLTVSTADLREAAILCNALMATKGKSYPVKGNSLTVRQIIMLPEHQLNKDSHLLMIHMLSPLCIREHRNGRDRYISVQDSDFSQQFNRVIAYQLKDCSDFTEQEKKSVQIVPYNMKKTVIRHYGQKIACSLGTAILTAEPNVLMYLYQSGIGSRRSSGFGLFDIITSPKKGGSAYDTDFETG